MKVILLIVSSLFFSFVSSGQDNVVDNKNTAQKNEIILQKQLIVTDLENRIKEIPYAAVRVYARYRTVTWLWKDGKDDTGRAVEIAGAAIADHYQNRDEIPPLYSSLSRLFVLLDAHSKDTARQLREKYKISSEDEARNITALLGQKDGKKLAVDAAVRLLSGHSETSPDLIYLILQLEQEGSPELNRLLGAILTAEASGRTRFPTHMIEMFSHHFLRPGVPVGLQKQFLGLIIAKSRNVFQMSEADQLAYYRMLQRLWPEISAYPELVAEASTALALLGTRVARATREAHERYERINNSSDKLAATVAEAERAEDKTTKYGLYVSAAKLALEKSKFIYAVDLMGMAAEIDMSENSLTEESLKSQHDYFYSNVVKKALDEDEPEAASYAIRKIDASVTKAETLASLSKYYVDNGEMGTGRNAYNEAIKTVSDVKNSPRALSLLIRMLSTSHKIDPTGVYELNRLISKELDNIPSLNIDDESGTDNYQNHVKMVMNINVDLFAELTRLIEENRNAVSDLTSRINKKEIRSIADLVLLTNPITDTVESN